MLVFRYALHNKKTWLDWKGEWWICRTNEININWYKITSRLFSGELKHVLFSRYKSRKGKISFTFKGRRRYIKPYIRIRKRWCRIRRRRGKITVRVRGRYRRFKLLRGTPAFRKGRKWRRIRYRGRISRRRRHQRRRKYLRKLRKLRRFRRYRRRMRRKRRRIRRSKRLSSSFMIYYRGKRRVVFRWKGRLTFRLGGKRRRIR